MSKGKKISGMGPPKVECWFCHRIVFKKRAALLPNGARVCHRHQCSLCGDYVRPEAAVVLNFGIDEDGNRKTEHVCGTHRRYILECAGRGGAKMQGAKERLEEIYGRSESARERTEGES